MLALLALLVSIAQPRIIDGDRRTPSPTQAAADIFVLETAAEEYARDNDGKYPDRLADLVPADATGRRYLEARRIPRDPWHNDYVYETPRPDQPKPRVLSYGADGAPGGTGDDADIDNFGLREKQP